MQIMVIAKDKPNPSFLYSFLAQQEKEDFFSIPTPPLFDLYF